MTLGRAGHSGKLPFGQLLNSCFKSNKNKKIRIVKELYFFTDAHNKYEHR